MPKAALWHPTRTSDALTGIGRYERALDGCDADGWTTTSIRRPAHPIRGATPCSWLLDYRQGDADLVHATAATAAVPALLHRADPLVVTSHGPIPVRYPELQRDWTTKLQWALQPRVLRRADAIMANSYFTKRELVDAYGVAASKIVVTHLGVDLERFSPDPPGPEPNTFGYSDDKPNVLILSSNLPQKRMDIAAEVIDRLTPAVRFVKAGYGETLAHPAVSNAGFVSEAHLPALYAGADVLFHPSEYESFGLPLLEAMACGTPVVAQNATAIPEVVGSAGELVDPENATAGFVQAIERALGGGYGARRQAERFPWSETVAKTVAVWEQVID